jgi:hypothetical protein
MYTINGSLYNFLNHFFHLKFSRICGNGVTSTCLVCADKLAALDIGHADVEPVTRHLEQTSPLFIIDKQSGKHKILLFFFLFSSFKGCVQRKLNWVKNSTYAWYRPQIVALDIIFF